MKEKKPGGTRPEMGTPEYEEWRKEILKRRRKRQLKERRKRLAIITAAMIVAVGASVGVGALKGRSEKASKEKTVSSDKQKEQTVSGEKALEAGTKNTETASKDTLAEAELLASQYNYDKAIDLLKKAPSYDSDKKMQAAAKKYEDIKATCTAWPLEKVTHVFYHILIKDPSKAFDGDYKEADYNQVMTTIDEFNKITQTMYDKGYVMVSIKDMAKADDNGNITEGEILLPPGKTPFVLSQDDVCYYHYMDGDGYATKLIVDDKGKIRNEYVEDDGSVSVGDYDMVPLIGGTDVIIFAFGTDITNDQEYSGDKFEYLKGQGYNYYCNVDSSQYYVQIRDRYFRQGRRNLDGYRMYYNPELLSDLFDVKDVFDPARPTPVPPM